MSTFNLDLGKYTKKVSEWVLIWVNESLDFMNDYAKKISPEDTWKFHKNHKIEKWVLNWNFAEWRIYNDTDYAAILEYWVKSKSYNYHKWRRWWPRKIIHTWVWNRTYSRTLDDNRQDVINSIKFNALKCLDKK